MSPQHSVPAVMAFAGLDPTGSAGLQADIESLASQGCHAAPVVTSVAVQDTRDVKDLAAMAPTLVIEQARAVLEDMPVTAFKIGLLGSVAIVEAVHSILHDYPSLPVILDPVLASGTGTPLSDAEMVDALRTLLLPITTVLTPNSMEARTLAPEADSTPAHAMALLDRGCEFVLITGGHEDTPEVVNILYGNRRELERFHWERLPGQFHGSGCTLASSIAGLLAQGMEPFSAIHEAQEYTWESLKHGYRVGMGQMTPNRLFWAKGSAE